MVPPKLSKFLLELHQSLAHQGLAKSLDISIGMPTLFANLAAIKQGKRSDLVGGALMRSAGGWSAIKALRRIGAYQKGVFFFNLF
ncbi:MAG: hypothetical protein JRJ25_09465 [Deltaproteobacteria bacterium]|nr:hypothetical protein [Deltaproteobacteria bacterium]